ncbi:MAG TPA: vitamin B12 dependent-methionine synthase activation domain-containing protein [Prolixibacteraceae bacterium]|nr:vitamin B12 dependent-methionine synthase activation domain-containing protein [Prolixibacteraceae bacterium]
MQKEYTFSFHELNIQPADIEELLGFDDGNVPEPFPELINKALKEAPCHCKIRGGIKIIDSIALNKENGSLKIADQLFVPAKIISIQLKNATKIAVFLCTAGSEITDLSKKAEAEGDLVYSHIVDWVGSVIVEKAMDKIQDSLEKEMQLNGLGITDRFSPGYCEWNVAEQQNLFQLLPTGFCGISLSKQSLMHPIKSVSGIIGIGNGLKPKGYQCYWCNDPNCIVGKTKQKKKPKKS